MADSWRDGRASQIVLTISSQAVCFVREERDGATVWARASTLGPGNVLPLEPDAERLTPEELLAALLAPFGGA
jgi:hypothetical protein